MKGIRKLKLKKKDENPEPTCSWTDWTTGLLDLKAGFRTAKYLSLINLPEVTDVS